MKDRMQRFNALMEESEQGLRAEACRSGTCESRVARRIIDDRDIYGQWESRHAELIRPIAERNARRPQVLQMRAIGLQMIHKRALFDHLRENAVVGENRERLFRHFYGSRDFYDAVVREHRQFMLAVSSLVVTDHLISVMHDPGSTRLLEIYNDAYAEYFDLYCQNVLAEHNTLVSSVYRYELKLARRRTDRLRARIRSAPPDPNYADFDRQLMVVRSGRYRVLDYISR